MRGTTLCRSVIVLIVAAITAMPAQAQVCTPAAPGLVSWWSGDGNGLDSRSRNNGTLQSGVSYTAGTVGQAFNFTAANQFVDIPNTPALFPQAGMTFEAWINPSTYVGCNIVNRIAHSVQTTVSGWGTAINCSNQRFEAAIFNDAGVGNNIFSISQIPVGQFTHVAYTWDGSQNRVYINGVLENTVPTTISMGINGVNLRLGNASNFSFRGQIDEPSLYRRALNDAEIAAIFNAGTAGKCKPTATVAPSGLVGWWSGDGNANDISGNGNNGTPQNGAGFGIGNVGQGFSFDRDLNQFVEIPHSTSTTVTGQITLEAWVNPADNQGTQVIISKYDTVVSPPQQSYALVKQDGGFLRFVVYPSQDFSLRGVDSQVAIPINTFTHVVATFDPTTQESKIYQNGVDTNATLIAGSTSVPTIFASTVPVRIGGFFNSSAGNSPFNGKIDEMSLYNRVLTQAEITSIFNAGAAGKLKAIDTPTEFADLLGSGRMNIPQDQTAKTAWFDSVHTPAGAVSVSVGDVTLTFDTVTTGGTTQQIPLSGVGLPALPSNPASTLIYDIATTAVFTGNVGLCFNLPSFTTAEVFATLFVVHLENGQWTNRTTTRDFVSRTVCAQTTSLSPFAIIPFAPTSANASISGQVATLGGRGISNVSVTITGGNLDAPRRSLTNAFGYYRLDDLAVGNTYILQVGSSKRFTFKNGIRVIDLNEDLTGADFFADNP